MKLETAPHTENGSTVVEIRTDAGELAGVVYASTRGVKIVSKYITNHEYLLVIDPGDPPAVLVDLATGMER